MKIIRALIVPVLVMFLAFWMFASLVLFTIQAYFNGDDGLSARTGEWIWTGGDASLVAAALVVLITCWGGYRAASGRSIWVAAGAGLAIAVSCFGLWVIWAIVAEGWGEAREFFVAPYGGLIGLLLALVGGTAGGWIQSR